MITGCCGFIGSHLTRECLRLGYEVLGVDMMGYGSNESSFKEFTKHPNFHFYFDDINNLKKTPNCDIIINLAAESAVGRSIEDCKNFLHSNINGVHNLLELIKGTNIPLFQVSTDEVLGDILHGSFKEDANYNPSNPYSATKASAELIIKSYARTFDIKYQIIRLTNNYGTNQDPEKLIPKSIKFLNENKKIPLHNNGTPLRNWLNVSDSVNAILTILERGEMNEIYHVNGNCELKNIETVLKIIQYFIYDPEFNIEKYCDFSISRPGQDLRYSLDDSKLRALGWKPKANFDEELEKIISYECSRLRNQVS